MPGKHITKQQEKLYMSLRKDGFTQEVASAKTGLSVRTGRTIEQGRSRKRHDWRTRKDPLSDVWEQELIPLLNEKPTLSAITLLEYLQNKYIDQYPDQVHRTLQRRVKHWRATQGPEKEVIFRQVHGPGKQGISDFTKLKGIIIYVAGKPYVHLFYHFRLSCSGWSHIKVIEGGESFSALAEGLQQALWRLGGVPLEHRTDSLSAAFKNLNQDAKDDLNTRYQALCEHYNMIPSRNNRGIGHENGSIESPHGHIKRRIKQALILRGSTHFTSADEYQEWIDGVVSQHNRRNAKQVDLERSYLRPLPKIKAIDFSETYARVNTSSTITIGRCTYSVPSRLIGEFLRVHLYHNRLECFLGATAVITLPRIHSKGRKRCRRIDYRHVIHSLVKKPQAFRFSALRDDLLPSDTYRFIWQYAERNIKGKEACKFMVNLLLLAAENDCEIKLGEVVVGYIRKGQIPTLSTLQSRFRKDKKKVPDITVEQHPLASYDLLFNQCRGVACGTY